MNGILLPFGIGIALGLAVLLAALALSLCVFVALQPALLAIGIRNALRRARSDGRLGRSRAARAAR